MSSYSDIDLSFNLTPNNDIGIIKDDACINVAIMNLLSFQKHDVFLNDYFGGFLKDILFESDNQVDIAILSSRIEWVLDTYEPRIKVNDVLIQFRNDTLLDIAITYTILKTEQEHTITYIRDIAHENRIRQV